MSSVYCRWWFRFNRRSTNAALWCRPVHCAKCRCSSRTTTTFDIFCLTYLFFLGYRHQRADEKHGNPPKVTRSRSGQRQSWKTPRWAWGEQVHRVWYFSLQCFDTVGWATWRASGLKKKLGVGLLVVTIWLELCTTYSSSCHHHFHHP